MMLALTIALLTGITVALLLIQRLRAKPWTEQGVIPGSQDDFTSSAPKVGLGVFLTMVTSLFALFTAAYLMRMGHGHGAELHDWHAISKPALLWLNTAVLIVASIFMERARKSAARDNLARDPGSVRSGFTAGGILTLVFLAGQLWVWLELQASGQYSASMPAYAFFILLTGVHALHLVGGLAVWTKTATRVWRGLEEADLIQLGKVRMSVQLCAAYWHYLLLVWLALFVLLLLT
jgi:cytochrome c oxidase subunit III